MFNLSNRQRRLNQNHNEGGWKKIAHAKGSQKKAGVAILISDTIYFKIKATTRDKEHYIMIKGSKQEDITIINIYVPNTGVTQYRRHMLTDIKRKLTLTK